MSQGSIVMPVVGPATAATMFGDVNAGFLAVQGQNSGSSAPANGPGAAPVLYQTWFDTTSNPVVGKYWDGTTWVVFGNLNTTAHVWSLPSPIFTGTVTAATANFSGNVSVASNSALAFTVGPNGSTNPALVVNASAASMAAGLSITGAASGGNVLIAPVDSGANTNLNMDAKGSGTLNFGAASTGAFTFYRASTFLQAMNAPSLSLTTPLAVSSGGTGVATLGSHGLLVGQGTGAVTTVSSSVGTSSLPLISQGVADPVYAQLSNGGLVNSSVTIGSTNVALGATAASIAGLSLTGTPTAPTAAANNNTTQIASTAFVASATSGLTATGDANYTILSSDRGVYHSALTAARTDTLPLANSVNPGQEFHITDFAGVATAVKTITLARSGSDTINGVTSIVAISAQYGAGIFWSDGVSKWTFFPASASGGGTVTTIQAGTGLTGGTITSSGTVALDPVYHRSYLAGLTLSTAGASATFGISAGVAVDSTNAGMMSLSSAYTKTASAWVVGSGNGALDSGSIAISTFYHVHLIKRTDTGVVDVLFSLSATSPILPTNYTLFRRIGSMKTDTNSQWILFSQNGDEFLWAATVADLTNSPIGTSALTPTLSVPQGIKVVARVRVGASNASSGASFLLNSLDETSVAVGNNRTIQSVTGVNSWATLDIRTDTSGRIRSVSDTASSVYFINTYGWIDSRGKNN